jgi:hypothetical protein
MDREAAGRNEAPGIWPIRPENERGQQSAAAHINSRGRSGHAVHGRRLFRVARYTRRFSNVHRPVRLYAPDGPEWVTGGKTPHAQALTERSSSHQGEFVNFTKVLSYPKPISHKGVPVWFGGPPVSMFPVDGRAPDCPGAF